MTDTITEIMDLPPDDLKPEHIDVLVAYHRNNRARLDAGEKPKKDRPKIAFDVSAVVSAVKTTPAKPKTEFVRRV